MKFLGHQWNYFSLLVLLCITSGWSMSYLNAGYDNIRASFGPESAAVWALQRLTLLALCCFAFAIPLYARTQQTGHSGW